MANIKVFSSNDRIEIIEVKNLLDEANIVSFEVNKMDSAYAGAFGDIEIYVNEADSEKALKALAELKS